MKTRTPGPFPLTVTKVGEFFVIATNQGNHYAKTMDPCAARLISAAPELLMALEMALPCVEYAEIETASKGHDGAHDKCLSALEWIRAAIAKAEGGAR